jgi:hypothetical protein
VDCAGQAGTRLGFGSGFGSVCLGTRHPLLEAAFKS